VPQAGGVREGSSSRRLRQTRIRLDHRARRGDPREHGRQAARSERDRPGGHARSDDELSHIRAAGGGALIP